MFGTKTQMPRATDEPRRVVCEIDPARSWEGSVLDALAACEEHDAELYVVWALQPERFGSTFGGYAGGCGTFGLGGVLNAVHELARERGIAATSALRFGREEVVLRHEPACHSDDAIGQPARRRSRPLGSTLTALSVLAALIVLVTPAVGMAATGGKRAGHPAAKAAATSAGVIQNPTDGAHRVAATGGPIGRDVAMVGGALVGLLLFGLYGDLVVGAVILALIVVVEAAARALRRLRLKLRPARPRAEAACGGVRVGATAAPRA